MPSWNANAGSGLSGTFWALALDPFSSFLGPAQAGSLGAWLLTDAGLFYSSNILIGTPSWTLKNALVPGVTAGILRPSTNIPGVLYIAWVNDPTAGNASQVYTARLTAYGVAASWTNTLGSANNGAATIGMDIDSYGADEMLVAVRDLPGFTATAVYRILNGSVTRLTGTSIPNGSGGSNIAFVQKPLQAFGGGGNSDTGSSESFIYLAHYGDGTAHVLYTADGGATPVDITPAGLTTGGFPGTISSIIPGDNSDVIAFITDSGTLYTSTNRGASWTNRGTDLHGLSSSIGYFPRLIAGQYALYMCGDSKLTFSPDFGATLVDKTGDWASAVGTPNNFRSVIPLY